jgi:hypothetical protein
VNRVKNSTNQVLPSVHWTGDNWPEVQKFLDTPKFLDGGTHNVATYSLDTNNNLTIKHKTGPVVQVAKGDYLVRDLAGVHTTTASGSFASNYTAIVE